MKEQKIPIKKALIWILLSILLICGSALFFTLCYFQIKELRKSHSGFNIYNLEQREKDGRILPINYLAYLLDLSTDKPTNLYQFDRTDPISKLLSAHVIEKAEIAKLPPKTIFVDYTLRTPFAKLSDYSNMAIDSQGHLFPYDPFYKGLDILEILIGSDEELKWGSKIDYSLVQAAEDIFNILREKTNVRRIDLSKIYATSLGQREIVVITQDRSGQFNILRLAPKNYQEQLNNYFQLKNLGSSEEFAESAGVQIIDLRISDLAFISAHK